MHAYVYTYMYIYMNTYIFVYIYIYICIYIHIYVYHHALRVTLKRTTQKKNLKDGTKHTPFTQPLIQDENNADYTNDRNIQKQSVPPEHVNNKNKPLFSPSPVPPPEGMYGYKIMTSILSMSCQPCLVYD
jgi:hypothetical protein